MNIMQITITEKNKNPLLKRTELKGEVAFDKITPSNTAMTEALAKEVKAQATLVVMKQIATRFSAKKAVFSAVAYDDQASKERTEKMTKHLRKKAEAEAKKRAEEAAAKKEEAKKKAEAEAAKAAEQEQAASEENKEAQASEAPAEEKSE